jgi:hypothetical protein
MWRINGHIGRSLNILESRIRMELRNGVSTESLVSLDYSISEGDGRNASIKTGMFKTQMG